MTDEKFTEILNGPLSHVLPMFMIQRLALALATVVAATGQAGEAALIAIAEEFERKDRAGYEDDAEFHREHN